MSDDPCLHCGEPTAFGSGRFVNRVPAEDEVDGVPRAGFVCEECLLCPDCGEEECGCFHPAGCECPVCPGGQVQADLTVPGGTGR